MTLMPPNLKNTSCSKLHNLPILHSTEIPSMECRSSLALSIFRDDYKFLFQDDGTSEGVALHQRELEEGIVVFRFAVDAGCG
jgi:hypothetical protein